MAAEHLYAVDKLHREDAVLVDDQGRAARVPLSDLPQELTENSVLRVPVSGDDAPDWSGATIDQDETERRKRQSADFTEKLRHSDEHGFLKPDDWPE
jgi:hypothetical protein